MKALKAILIFTVSIGMITCQKDDDSENTGPCDKRVIENKALFDNTETGKYKIKSAVVSGDCLEMEISSGGCDGNSWEMELVDSGTVVNSNPVQRFVRVALKNEELCEAQITKKVSFDLSPLQRDGKPVSLELDEWEEKLLYEY